MTTASALQAQPRTAGARQVDRLLGRALKLPKAASGYSVRRGVPVPMRDGAVLLADHYVPDGAVRGTVLVRSPYGRAGLFGLLFARPYAERGYHVVIQSCRGTFGSTGQIGAFAGEVEDGADTVAWLRTEPWFTGTFATLGVSYLGLTQWAILMDPPPELRAAIITSGPHDTGRLLYGSGAFSLLSIVGWTDVMLHQQDHGTVRSLLSSVVAGPKRMQPVLDGLPLGGALHAAYGDRAPWLDRWLAHPDPKDAFWDDSRVTEALSRVDVPVLMHTGWHDLIGEQVLESYDALHGRGLDVSLVVGPWNHADLAGKGAGVLTRDTLGWLAEHLAGDGNRTGAAPVRVAVTGTDAWRDLAAWPPATQEQVLHLHPGGGLGALPSMDVEPMRFTYDPTAPTPTVGGMTNARDAGRQDNRSREKRADVLTFTGPVLSAPVEIAGRPVVELAHGSDNPHADVFVRLCEVDAKGRSWNLSDGYVRLQDAGPEQLLRLELSATAHVFRPGTRIRIQISGGSHPQHDRNLGTGEPAASGAVTRPSHRTLLPSSSRLLLPVTS